MLTWATGSLSFPTETLRVRLAAVLMPAVSFQARAPITLTLNGAATSLPDTTLASYEDTAAWLTANTTGLSWDYIESSNLFRVTNASGAPATVQCDPLGFGTAVVVPDGASVSGEVQPVLQWLHGIVVRCNLFRGLASTAGGSVDAGDVAGVVSTDGETIRWENLSDDYQVCRSDAVRSGIEVRLQDLDGNLLVPTRNVTVVLSIAPNFTGVE